MLTKYRGKIRASLNPAHNDAVVDTQKSMLQTTQERLWEEYDWPHLRVERNQPLQAGQRYYEPPEDVIPERIDAVNIFENGRWRPLLPYITSNEYNVYNSALDERSSPARNWRLNEEDQIEIWPVSDVDGNPDTLEDMIQVVGIRNLRPLVSESDRADLDDNMIVLMAAAEQLQAMGAKDASLKLAQANRLVSRLTSDLTKTKRFRMFGGTPGRRLFGPPGPPKYTGVR